MKIGVFDSGVGGEAVYRDIQDRLPEAEILLLDDRDNLPYGDKSAAQMIDLLRPIIQDFNEQSVDAIVIACNSASTNCLPALQRMSRSPVVGFVPMIKPAVAASKTGSICVCATPATLGSSRYAELKSQYASEAIVVEPDCSSWANLIENDQLADVHLGRVVSAAQSANADVIVLGCTHFHWIQDRLQGLAGSDITVMHPTSSVIDQLVVQLGLEL